MYYITIHEWYIDRKSPDYIYGKEFASRLEPIVQQRQLSREKHHNTRGDVVSSRVREIARSTLQLSDIDIDDFFDNHEEWKVTNN